MPEIISRIEEVTPDWLTRTLREQGALPMGEVIAIHRRANDAFNSAIAHLDVNYSAEAPAEAPGRLLVKLNANHDGKHEAIFYSLAATLAAPPPALVRCYAALYDAHSGNSCCLLEDVSETHVTPVTRRQVLSGEGVPSEIQLEKIVEAAGRFHAYWWEHPLLGKVEGVTEVRWWYQDEEHFRQHIQRRQDEWARFIAAVGDWFPADLRALYEEVLAKLPALWDRCLARRVTAFKQITMSNGDCYFAQTLCPKDPTTADAYIVDFQDASANYGAYDLVYLFATFWTPKQRRENWREERLLRRYHEILQANGVKDYSWDNLMEDYRLMIIFMIFDPVWNQTSGSGQDYWWPKLQCLTGAFQDLHCAALF